MAITRAISGVHTAQDEMSLAFNPGHSDRHHLIALDTRGQAGDFLMRVDAFHRCEEALRLYEVPASRNKVAELGKSARDGPVEPFAWLPVFGPPNVNRHIAQLK